MSELQIVARLASALVSVLITFGIGMIFEYGHLV